MSNATEASAQLQSATQPTTTHTKNAAKHTERQNPQNPRHADDATQPTTNYTAPPCPEWCTVGEGHLFEPLGGEMSRGHEGEFGEAGQHAVAVASTEIVSADSVSRWTAPFIDLDVSGVGDADEAGDVG